MIDAYTVTGIGLGLVGVLALCISNIIQQRRQAQRAKRQQGLTFRNGVTVFLAGAAISAGVKVCVLALNPALFPSNGDDRTYVFLGGLSVIWVSLETIWELLAKR